VPQERVSQYTGYWLKGDWANLLSLKSAELLTGDLLARIVKVFASFPQWGQEQVYAYLHQHGQKLRWNKRPNKAAGGSCKRSCRNATNWAVAAFTCGSAGCWNNS